QDFPVLVKKMISWGWLVEIDGKKVRQSGDFNISVSSGIDWFDVDAEMIFDGHISAGLKQLLNSMGGNNLIQLSDGSVGILPEKWLKRFLPLSSLGSQKKNSNNVSLRFQKSQGLFLDALLSEEKNLKSDEIFKNLQNKIQSFSGIKPLQAPEGFKGSLRSYQKEGLAWLHFLEDFGLGGILADDMGLGKTVQFLAYFINRNNERKNKKEQPCLVVSPKSVVFNWVEEAKKFSPKLSVLTYIGIGRHMLLSQFFTSDIVVTTFHTMRQDIEILKDIKFDCIVLDEAQAIKNQRTLVSKASGLLKADYKLAMTGTPIENRIDDLYSILDFINPGFITLKAQGVFSRMFNGYEQDQNLLESFSKAIKPIILRRTKSQVLKDLPQKTEQVLHCELSSTQKKLYEELRDYYRLKVFNKIEISGIAKSKMNILEALLRLRQIACHPGLIDRNHRKNSSAKLDLLLEHLPQIINEGHKSLIFSQFTSFLSIIRENLDKHQIKYEYLDGQTTDRQSRVERFQNDKNCKVFLISLKAGGMGLNLTAADYVYLLDPWWNPAVETQAIDRTHRIGQTKKVFAYRMVARDTIEEKILELQKKKTHLASTLITSDKSFLQKLTREDIHMLLS
ncbi:MAG: SNF2 helicase associated domain-containing protein, partial [Deltaproteobacteria bacterium]|nr:SNF2 helicase associated domain-containing protein [Deltaproteobacteria bacterium]